jgi:predicted ATPase
MHLKSVNIHADSYPTREFYPFNLEVLEQTDRIDFRTPVTLLAGENGTGKSTLLEAIANRAAIHIWEDRGRVRCKVNPYENKLYRCISLDWTDGRVPGSFFGAAVFRDFARILDEWAATDPGQLDYFGGQSLLTQSHGQSLMAFFKARYAVRGLYLLDEPETALSPKSQIGLLQVLARAGAAGHAQFVIATHSPILLACPGATIYSFDHVPVRTVDYEQTDHYQMYRRFMTDRQQFLEDNDGNGSD